MDRSQQYYEMVQATGSGLVRLALEQGIEHGHQQKGDEGGKQQAADYGKS
jgi:hypothetical protein